MTNRDIVFKLQYRDALRAALLKVAANPAASASISVGGGSKSWSFRNVEELRKALREVEAEIAEFRRSVSGSGSLDIEYARWC